MPLKCSSDRGPEMRKAIVSELCAWIGVDKREGISYQPTSQAPTKHDHFESKATLTCIIEDLAACYTTEWEFYLPAGEYLKMITPHSGDTDLCPQDLDHGWSLAANMSRGLFRFRTDLSECESEFAACLFANFLQLKASFDRFVSKETEARVAEANLTRGNICPRRATLCTAARRCE